MFYKNNHNYEISIKGKKNAVTRQWGIWVLVCKLKVSSVSSALGILRIIQSVEKSVKITIWILYLYDLFGLLKGEVNVLSKPIDLGNFSLAKYGWSCYE